MQLYIGNKNYSSWSMRPWVLMRHAGVPFDEVRLRLSFEGDSDFKRRLAAITPTGRVPVLVDDGFAVWDTLAIAEYVAEKVQSLPGRPSLWPADARDRARARSLCAEMHSGFAALRSHCPMNIEADLPDVGARLLRDVPEIAVDLARITSMWQQQLAETGGPFLFGEFSVADAYFAPVCMRLRTYALPVPERARGYVAHMLELPAVRQWADEARAEHDFLAFDDPYRAAP